MVTCGAAIASQSNPVAGLLAAGGVWTAAMFGEFTAHRAHLFEWAVRASHNGGEGCPRATVHASVAPTKHRAWLALTHPPALLPHSQGPRASWTWPSPSRRLARSRGWGVAVEDASLLN